MTDAVVFYQIGDISSPYYRGETYFKFHRDRGGHCVGTSFLVSGNKQRSPIRTYQSNEVLELARESVKECLRRFHSKAIKDQAFNKLMMRLYGEMKEDLEETLDEALRLEKQAMWLRSRRFFRKVYNNDWTHFATFTYDDKKWGSEIEFQESLNQCLSNLHSRRGWKCIGGWERGDQNDRLHFHALLYVPEGQMVGTIERKEEYSHKIFKKKIRYENDFFLHRYGRNDFNPICEQMLNKVAEYIGNYILKSGDKIRYSRGTPSDYISVFCRDDIAMEYSSHGELLSIIVDGSVDWEKARPSDNAFERVIRHFLLYGRSCVSPPMVDRQSS